MKKFIFSLKLPEEIPRVGSDLLTQNYVRIKTLQESGIVGEDNGWWFGVVRS
jgi:hypothetical protein